MQDILAPILSACVATACAISGAATYLNDVDLQKERSSPSFYYSVEDNSDSTSEDLKVSK